MRHPIQNWILERAEIFHVLRDAKWVIGISAIVSIALFLPDQTRELYRIFIADITFVSPSIHDALVIVLRTARFILPIITIGVVLWFGTYQVTTESFNRIESPSILVKDFVRGLPAICGAAPLVACALGQLGARPHASKGGHKRGEGRVLVTVHREGLKSEVPLGGSRQDLDPGDVRRACEELGLDWGDLPKLSEPGRSEPLSGSLYCRQR